MYANTRRVMCLNIHAEEVGKVLPTKSRQAASNDTYTTFIFDIEIPMYKERLFKLNFPLIVIQKSTVLHKHFWIENSVGNRLFTTKPNVNIVVFDCDAFWLRQLEVHNLRQFLKMTG